MMVAGRFQHVDWISGKIQTIYDEVSRYPANERLDAGNDMSHLVAEWPEHGKVYTTSL